MSDFGRIAKRLRLLELINEAGHTLQRSPALAFCVCFALAYMIHFWGVSRYWLYLELGGAVLSLIGYLYYKRREEVGYVGYRPSILGYLATFFLVLVLWGVRLEYAGVAKPFPIKNQPLELADRLRQELQQVGVRPETSILLTGLSLGDVPREGVGREVRANFVRSGVAHLLSVSGFHLGVVAGVLHFFLMRLPLGDRGRRRRLLVISGAWGFVALTGWAVPTIRAALMLSIYLIGRIICRPIRFSQLLALSAIAQFLYNPHIVQSWSFALSYAAVASIYLLSPWLIGILGQVQQPVLRYIWVALCITLAAQIGVLPLCLHYFGMVSWSFLWVALPASLLASLLIPITLLFALCVFIGLGQPLLALLGAVLDFLAEQMLSLVSLGSRAALYQSGDCPFWLVLLWWSIIILYALCTKLPKKPQENPPSLLEILK